MLKQLTSYSKVVYSKASSILFFRRTIVLKKQLFSSVLGLAATVFSQGLFAEQICNSNVSLTKPDSIYIDHLDGTVSDIETTLMWQKCSFAQTWNAGADVNDGSDDSCDGTIKKKTWQAALGIANDNTDNGYSDWRLPNKNELMTLFETACHTPSINEALFPGTPWDVFYWTSTPFAYDYSTYYKESAVAMLFYVSEDSVQNKDEKYHIRLVRGGH